MTSHYSDIKVAYHSEHLKTLRTGKIPVPVSLQIVLSDLCNHDCNFCFYRRSNNHTETFKENGSRNPNRKLESDKVIKLLSDASDMGVKSIVFTGGGEPTLHQDHEVIFQKVLDDGMEVGLITNGSRGSDLLLEQLMSFTWIRISLDAATAKTYSAVHAINEGAYNRTLNNIRRIISRRQETNSSLTVGISYVLTEDNLHEIESTIALAESLCVDYIRFVPETGTLGRCHSKIIECKKRIENCESSIRVYAILDRESDNHVDFSQCLRMGYVLYIGGDFKIYACCQVSYTYHGCIGDLSEQSFKTWWTNNKDALLKTFDPKKCGRCVYANINRSLEYLTGNAEHVNFI